MAKPGVSGGDGKTSPFGDGRGGVGMSGAKPRDLIANPGGATGGPATPPVPGMGPSQSLMKQQMGSVADLDTASAEPGGLLPFDDVAKSMDPRVRDQGVGTRGNSAKPFRLGGG